MKMMKISGKLAEIYLRQSHGGMHTGMSIARTRACKQAVWRIELLYDRQRNINSEVLHLRRVFDLGYDVSAYHDINQA